MKWILCELLGHKWEHLPDKIPEDRDTYQCKRCQRMTLHPSSGLPVVPEEDRV